MAARGSKGCAGLLLLGILALIGALVGGYALLRANDRIEPRMLERRCVLTADDHSVALDLDQARYASIIVGIAQKRGLSARAGSIAMATAFQESQVHNIDYGDRDSVGLFQQRPSQGWGTVKQIMDPYYSTNKFYDALVKVRGWELGDINDVAQKVQRSGFPEAYRDHEDDGRTVSSVLSGYSPAGMKCLYHDPKRADADGLETSLRKTLGVSSSLGQEGAVTVQVASKRQAWAVAHHAQANAQRFGVVSIRVGGRSWKPKKNKLTGWQDAESIAGKSVVIRLNG